MDSVYRATNKESLARVDGTLHDEAFELSAIRSSPDENTVTIPVRRKFHDGPEELIERGLLFKTYEKDWMRTIVTVHNVRSWKPLKDQGIDSYTFSSWRHVAGKIRAECNENLVLEFVVEEIDVEIQDIGFDGRARIKRGPLGFEIESSIVY